jgi:predicted O-methyltransferase YrrM
MGSSLDDGPVAAAAGDRYMPVSTSTGRLLHSLARATHPTIVAEFGFSEGISAPHLASAWRDNDFGQLFATELSCGGGER